MLGGSHTTAPCDIDGNGLQGQDDEQLYPKSDKSRRIHGLSTGEQRSVLTPEDLAKRWHIGLDAARRTMGSTTQKGIINVLAPGDRKVRQRLGHLKYPALKGRFCSDTSFSQVESTRGNSAAQQFTNGLGYDRFYPIKYESRAAEALMSFIHDAGIPQTLVTDNANAETDGEWGKTVKVHHIQQKFFVPHSPW